MLLATGGLGTIKWLLPPGQKKMLAVVAHEVGSQLMMQELDGEEDSIDSLLVSIMLHYPSPKYPCLLTLLCPIPSQYLTPDQLTGRKEGCSYC